MRKFGVELECYIDSLSTLLEAFVEHDIDHVLVKNSEKHVLYENQVKLIKDSSLKKVDNLDSIELNLPPSVDFNLLYKICNILTIVNAQCILNCALHIHIDLTDKTIQDGYNIMGFYEKNEEKILTQIYQIQKTNSNLNISLKDNHWWAKWYSDNTHMKLNQPYQHYKTIEHRAFMGTIDYHEIVQCILLTQEIVEEGLKFKWKRT